MTDTPEAVRLADQIHAGNGEWMQKAAALLRRIPGLEAEVLEQARLNGIGAERELALMAQVSRLEAERDQLREAIKKQSNAVTLFQKVASENARHFADANLRREADLSTAEAKSVAEANAILTAENDQLRAELEKVRVPEGWKLVPVEPTPEMIHAVRFAGDPDSPAIGDPIIADVTAFPLVGGDVALRMCRAMLTAAPTQPNADQKGQ